MTEIEKILTAFGLSGLIFIGFLYLLFNFIKDKLSSIAKETSNQILEDYKNQKLLYFRDEKIREALLINIGNVSTDKKLETYNHVYELFFEVNSKLHSLLKDDSKKYFIYEELWEKAQIARELVFKNSIYLGKLVDYLLHSVIGLTDQIRYWPSSDFKKDSYDPSDQIQLAEKWIQKNVYSHNTIKNYELDDDYVDNIKTERDNYIANDLDLKND